MGVLDNQYLAITFLVTCAMQFSFFAIAAWFRFDKVTDFAGSMNFVLLAWLTFLLNKTYFARQIVVTIMVTVWGLRLGIYLLARVLKRGSDARFDEIREKFWSFLGFWIFQIVWVWVVSLPVTVLNASAVDEPIGGLDIAGWVLWGIGFALEIAADASKDAYYSNPNKPTPFLQSGVWSISRHPNYLGEILLWTGIFLSSCATYPDNWDAYWTVLSPVLTYILLVHVSGIPPAEARYDEKYGHLAEYQEYKATVPPLVPFPCYGAFPSGCKRVLCCERSPRPAAQYDGAQSYA